MTDYPSVGGRERPDYEDAFAKHFGQSETINAGPLWDFGWIPPQVRTVTEIEANARALAAMPSFEIVGNSEPVKKACLFELWRHEEVKAALGFEYPGTHQLTGSCVGAGGGNVHFSVSAVEVIRLRDPEQILIPFWLFTYGRSRFHCGMRGRGEGSLGSCYAKASTDDGSLPGNLPELPQPKNTDGLIWGSSVEYEWSAGDRAPCTQWMDRAKRHLMKTAARCRSADDVRAAIVNGYPCTAASMYGHNPRVVGEGSDAVLMGIKGPRWSHQMSVQAWWEHPKHGELFWLHNQWGLRAHGTDPAGGPAGGVWISKADMDWICRDEVFAFSQFNGFPAQRIPWIF